MGVYRDTRTRLWRYDFVRMGRRWTRKGFTTAAKARSAEHDLRRDLDRGLTDAFSTFAQLVDAWLTASAGTKSLAHVSEVKARMNRTWTHLADLPPKAITRGHIEPTLMRLAAKMQPNTVNAYRASLSAVLNYGVALGALPYNPCRGIPRIPDSGIRKQPVPTATLRALILAADPDLQARLIFCANTGCRWVEMARLQWDDLHLGERSIALLTTRKRRGGHVTRRPQPLTPAAIEAIESMRGRDPVFIFAAPHRRGMAAYATDKLHLRQLCDRVGAGRYSWHQVRHWVGMTAARAGKNRRAIADLLGQQSVSATDRYIHAAASEVWEMAGALEDALALPAGGTIDGTRDEKRGVKPS